MSIWTAVKTWSASVVSVADLQTYVSDNTNYLKDVVDTAVVMKDRDVAVASVASTTTETVVYTYAVPGGTLGTNKIIRMSMIGDIQNTTGAANVTMTVRVKYGATTIFTGAVPNVNTAVNKGFLNLDCELAAFAATNAQAAKTSMWIAPVDAATTAGTAVSKDAVGGAGTGQTYTGGIYLVANHNSIAEDSTASKNLVITFQMSVSNAAAIMRALTVHTELR